MQEKFYSLVKWSHKICLGFLPESLIGFGIIGILGFITHGLVAIGLGSYFHSFLFIHLISSFIAGSQNFILNAKLNFSFPTQNIRDTLLSYLKFMFILSPSVFFWGLTLSLYLGPTTALENASLSLTVVMVDFFLRYVLSRYWVFKK